MEEHRKSIGKSMSSELRSKDICRQSFRVRQSSELRSKAELQVPFQDNGAFILGNNVLNMKNMIHDGPKINESERI